MSAIVVCAAIVDAILAGVVVWRLVRSLRRGLSLRFRIFGALAIAILSGALATGLYAIAEDARTIGFAARFAHVAPKAFVLASALLPLAAAAAALVGRRLARSVEDLSLAASRIAEGERTASLPAGDGAESRRLARALASMRRELEGKPYAAAFLRDAWHDLKTPVAAIVATIEVLEDGALEDPTAARTFVANLRSSAEQLDRQLADLVTLARFETAALPREREAAMGAMVEHAIALVEPLARARGVCVAKAAGASRPDVVRSPARERDRLRCDEAALSRALANLLENAVDASPGGSVEIAVDDRAGDAIVVDVANEPSAVPKEMRDRLFERATTARKGKGSGLGLAISRAAVEAHGGRIRFIELGPPRVCVRIELPR